MSSKLQISDIQLCNNSYLKPNDMSLPSAKIRDQSARALKGIYNIVQKQKELNQTDFNQRFQGKMQRMSLEGHQSVLKELNQPIIKDVNILSQSQNQALRQSIKNGSRQVPDIMFQKNQDEDVLSPLQKMRNQSQNQDIRQRYNNFKINNEQLDMNKVQNKQDYNFQSQNLWNNEPKSAQIYNLIRIKNLRKDVLSSNSNYIKYQNQSLTNNQDHEKQSLSQQQQSRLDSTSVILPNIYKRGNSLFMNYSDNPTLDSEFSQASFPAKNANRESNKRRKLQMSLDISSIQKKQKNNSDMKIKSQVAQFQILNHLNLEKDDLLQQINKHNGINHPNMQVSLKQNKEIDPLVNQNNQNMSENSIQRRNRNITKLNISKLQN